MKSTGKCSKCASGEIFRTELDDASWGVVLSLFVGVRAERYVCCDCGFIEQWVARPSDLERVREALRKQREEAASSGRAPAKP